MHDDRNALIVQAKTLTREALFDLTDPVKEMIERMTNCYRYDIYATVLVFLTDSNSPVPLLTLDVAMFFAAKLSSGASEVLGKSGLVLNSSFNLRLNFIWSILFITRRYLVFSFSIQNGTALSSN